MAGTSRAQLLGLGGMLVLAVLAPLVAYPVFLMKVACFALFAAAFNLLLGYVGLLSFGHAAYFGMGGYIAGTALKGWGLTPELAILAGGVGGALLGVAFGWLAIRRQGIYFAMITLALAQMVYFVCLEAPFTGGENGIQGIPRGRLFGLIDLAPDMHLYWLVLAIVVGGLALILRAVHSPFGQVLMAIRENEPRTISLGYRVEDYKLVAFVMSAFLAGVAGAAKAVVFGIATLTDVHWTTSGQVVLMVLLGGLATQLGPVIGALLVVGMETYLASFGDWVDVVQGLVLVMCVLLFRRGIVGEISVLAKLRL